MIDGADGGKLKFTVTGGEVDEKHLVLRLDGALPGPTITVGQWG